MLNLQILNKNDGKSETYHNFWSAVFAKTEHLRWCVSTWLELKYNDLDQKRRRLTGMRRKAHIYFKG